MRTNNRLEIHLSARILLIIQLCIGFSYLFWLVGYPFMGGYFRTKSELILIESVIGSQISAKMEGPAKKSTITAHLFTNLDPTMQNWVMEEAKKRDMELKAPFFQKLGRAFSLIRSISPTEISWALLAVLLPLFILLNKPSALSSIWLLPLLAFAYSVENAKYGLDPLKFSDKGIFPKESELVSSPTLLDRKELELAWKKYLIEKWAHEKPSPLEEEFYIQSVKGEFYFNLKRIASLPSSLNFYFWEKSSYLLLGIYVLWNLFFAIFVRGAIKFVESNK